MLQITAMLKSNGKSGKLAILVQRAAQNVTDKTQNVYDKTFNARIC